MKKIAFYLPRPNYGGVSRVLMNLAESMSEQVNVCIITNKGFSRGNKFLPNMTGVSFLELPSDSNFLNILYLGMQLRKNNFTHMITASSLISCYSLISMLLFNRRVRVIVTEHTMLSSEARITGRLIFRLMPTLMRLLYPYAKNVVAISQGIKEDLVSFVGLKASSVLVINNLVLSDYFCRMKNASVDHEFFAQDGKVVVFVGRLESVKNPNLLIDSFALLPDILNARLLVIGDGPLDQELRERVNQLGIQESVSFLGYVENPAPYIRRADVLALTSQWEGMPGVIIEALACNTPVVATDCAPGIREIFLDKVYGKIVPNYNPAALAEALYDVLDGNIDLHDMDERAKDFSSERVVAEYVKLLA